MVGGVRVVVVDGTTLRSNAHNLRLISSALEVRAVAVWLRTLLPSDVLAWILMELEMGLRAAAS